jgi:hypothetical protein
MSRIITGGKDEALEEAALCRLRAAAARSEAARREYRRLASGWRRLAEHFDLAARVSGYVEWRAGRLRDQ